MAPAEFSFKWFAEQNFYKAVNAYLVDVSGIRPGQKVVELACGTGAVTRMILEKLRGARESLVIGIDMSASALREAREQLGEVREGAIQFIQDRVERLTEVVRERVDGVIFCNGIHYIPDKQGLLSSIARALQPGGIFAFNTAFYQGAIPPETEQFYRRWMVKALRTLKAHYGLSPQRERVESRKPLTAGEYRSLLEGAGFTVAREEVKTAPVTLQGWVDISRYEDFIQGALPGIPLEEGSKTLQETVTLTFQEMGLASVPRNWLTVVAVKA